MERSVTAAGAQDEMIAQASESFGAMNQNVNELVTDIGEIDTMLNNLSKANNQIVENIMQLSATTEEVTASSVQAADLSVKNLGNAEKYQGSASQCVRRVAQAGAVYPLIGQILTCSE